MRAAWVLGVVGLATVATATPASADTDAGPCALVLVVDRSASMKGEKLAGVKRAVIETIAALESGNQIAVVGFDDTARVYVPLQSVTNRKRIAAQIARIKVGKGDDIVAGLRSAFDVLRVTKLDRKQVVVITDGDRLLGVEALIEEMRREGITVSAVGVQSSNRMTMEKLATAGDGRAHIIEDLTELDELVIAETTKLPPSRGQLALVLVIDRSGSMAAEVGSTTRFAQAKAVAVSAIDAMDPDDMIAVVLFDANAKTEVEMHRVGRRTQVVAAIAALELAGDGTNVFPGLREAFGLLRDRKATRKHVLVISDGTFVRDGLAALTTEMRAEHITVSAVGVSRADRSLLSIITSAGGGHLFSIDDGLAGLARTFE